MSLGTQRDPAAPGRRPRPVARALLACGAAAVAAEYLPSVVTLGQWTPARSLPGDLCRWRGPGAPEVALTFDDGPHPEATPAMLEALDELGLRATFFCLGAEIVRHPDLVSELLRRGHQVETHGFAHEHHLLRSPRWVLRDLRRARAAAEAVGLRPTWYRPTYGQVTGATLVVARALGLRPVLWSSWGREWATDDPAEVARRISTGLSPGAIVLLHDSDRHGRPGMWRTGIDALRLVADDLARRDLRAVTVERMMLGRGSAPIDQVGGI